MTYSFSFRQDKKKSLVYFPIFLNKPDGTIAGQANEVSNGIHYTWVFAVELNTQLHDPVKKDD